MRENNVVCVSVIVPLYNCEVYIDELLRSLSRQTFRDFEVICVDDGSTDGTLEAVRSFCEKDGRFTFLANDHAGAGAARNAGMDVARGEYIIFLDVDDLYKPELLQKMYDAASRYEVDEVFCLYEETNCRTGITQHDLGFRLDKFPPDTVTRLEAQSGYYFWGTYRATNALFRKDLIDAYGLRFSTTQVANDAFFIYAYFSIAQTKNGLPCSSAKGSTRMHTSISPDTRTTASPVSRNI